MRTVTICCSLLLFYFSDLSQDSLVNTAQSKKVAHKKGADDVFIALNVGGALGDTKNAVRNNMGNLGFGASIEILWDPFKWGGGKGPMRIGGEISYSYYGRFI